MNFLNQDRLNTPNQFKELIIEIDGTVKRAGIPLSAFGIKNVISADDQETVLKQGQKIKLTQLVSGAEASLYARLNDYNITIKDVVVSRGVELPKSSVAGVGKLYVIKDMSGSAASTTITIAAVDGESIDGEPTQSITTDWGVKRLVSDGSNWFSW